MGKCESATVSIGIKILLSDLIMQLNENNFDLIQNMLQNGCIEDSNDYYNEVYTHILSRDIELFKDYNDYKEYLIKEFKTQGSYQKSKFSNEIKQDLSNGSLFEQHLLFPLKDIIETERWGHDRYGTNSASVAFENNLSVNIDEYKDIKNFSIIFMIAQNSD